MDCVDLDFRPKLKPIVIRKDSLGPNFPTRDLTVSPQHRILVRSRIAKRMFDAQELLVPANKLTGFDDIDVIHDNPRVLNTFICFLITMKSSGPTERLQKASLQAPKP